MSLLVISEILGLSVSTLTANDKYSFRISQNLQQPIKMQLSKKHNYFLLNILLNFLNRHQNLNILKKKMTLIASVFPKLWTAKVF